MNRLAGKTTLLILGVFILVDTLATVATGQSLTAITVDPPDPTIAVDKIQPFTATGAFSDGSKRVLSPATTIAAGSNHTCTVLSDGDGRVKCWGSNLFGQLGDGTTTDSSTPVEVTKLTTAVAVTAGGGHTCVLLSDGMVKCGGDNSSGQLGNGSTINSSTMVAVTGISTATAIAAGGAHTCARLSNGTVRCWGNNLRGQLGDGTTTDSSIPAGVIGITTAVSVAAGGDHTCALMSNFRVRCWGNNFAGQLGNGTTTNSSMPVAVTGISTATWVAAGASHTCAVLSVGGALTLSSAGVLTCWGSNVYGQLGDGRTINSTIPVALGAGPNNVQVATGFFHTCALLGDGAALCWGHNNFGQLGNGTLTDSTTGLNVNEIIPASWIAAGDSHTCATVPFGFVAFGSAVLCWGHNDFGQLGNGTTTDSSTTVAVTGISNASYGEITAGGSHTCVLLSSGGTDRVRCWGHNDFGQLGDGTTTDSSIPVATRISSYVIAVAAGGSHTCAIGPVPFGVATGPVACWGRNNFGQLGNGTTTDYPIPVSVTGISNAIELVAGRDHTCAILSDLTVRCWGRNDFGQMGNGTTTSSSIPVVATGITLWTNVNTLAAGGDHTCAVNIDLVVRCWGRNDFGQLGNGTTTSSSIPVVATHSYPSLQVTTGGNHTCVVRYDLTGQCWGHNDFGQLGNGTTIDSVIPAAVTDISNVTLVTAGGGHTCAQSLGGVVRCWGRNNSGQLGNRTTTNSSLPVIVSGITPAAALSWSTDVPSVATSDGNGFVTGLSSGTAIICAFSGGVTGCTRLTVR